MRRLYRWVILRSVRAAAGSFGRRSLLLALAAGTAAMLAGDRTSPAATVPDGWTSGPRSLPSADSSQAEPLPVRPALVPPHPGPPVVVRVIPGATRHLALTIDDGYDADVVAAYVQFASDSGVHLTFNPNGIYASTWRPQAAAPRPLIDAGQVQLGNHTYSHLDLRRSTDIAVRAELERNEQWIEQTFGTTTRPWFRPPYGRHTAQTDTAAAAAGWTRVLMWNGSFGDARLITPDVLLQQAQRYLQPGVVMLGHANHPTITSLYGQILELIRSRDLTPATLDEAFGTSRATG